MLEATVGGVGVQRPIGVGFSGGKRLELKLAVDVFELKLVPNFLNLHCSDVNSFNALGLILSCRSDKPKACKFTLIPLLLAPKLKLASFSFDSRILSDPYPHPLFSFKNLRIFDEF